jgi:hypothetical protein
VNTDPSRPGKHREGLSKELDAIVMKAIAKDPAKRFATWDEFGAALAEIWKAEHKAEEKRDESDTERFSVMRTLPFFRDFPENELWEVLRLTKWAKFKPETALIKEGDHGDSFYILAGGYVRVTIGKKTLSVLTAGDCFGEMSYLAHLDAPHRSATVTTNSDVIVLKIRAEDLKQLAIGEAPVRRALPRHPRRPPRSRQPAALGDVLAVRDVERGERPDHQERDDELRHRGDEQPQPRTDADPGRLGEPPRAMSSPSTAPMKGPAGCRAGRRRAPGRPAAPISAFGLAPTRFAPSIEAMKSTANEAP